jgi:hypothetical protein
MKTLGIVCASLLSILVACGGKSAPAQTPATTETASATTATKPDVEKLKTHIKSHAQYPASRQQILEACANTPEFTEGEKAWISENLAEGNYANADEVITALKL